jgi:8-oxo-dGTP diphosphatase
MPVVVVRHAHAGSRTFWHGDDRDRPLSPKGREQAELLVPVLSDRFRATRLLTSPFLRCVDTLVPTAEARGVDVELVDDLAEGNGPATVALLRGLAGATGSDGPGVVCCTHGDVAVAVYEAFGPGEGGGVRPTLQKGGLWVLGAPDGTLGLVEYLPPPVVVPE